MAIDDNAVSRTAVLDRVRSALRKRGVDGDARMAADAYLAARKQGPRPALAGDLAARFAARAQDMESSVDRVGTLDDVVAAVGRYVDTIGAVPDPETNPRAGVCWPEFGWLDWSRAINLVSGPSRTGDIEQTIVLGAHGPRRLHVVLVG